DGKAGLDDGDAHLLEQLGDFELLLVGHRRAGALLAVAQGGIEDIDAVLFGLRWHCHKLGSFSRAPVCWALMGSISAVPLSAQAPRPSRPSGDGKQQEPAENEGG